jgi:hypothetical protein
VAVGDAEVVGHLRHERDSETETWAVGPGDEAPTLVTYAHQKLLVVAVRFDDDRAWLLAEVSVPDDIGDCFADGERDRVTGVLARSG